MGGWRRFLCVSPRHNPDEDRIVAVVVAPKVNVPALHVADHTLVQ